MNSLSEKGVIFMEKSQKLLLLTVFGHITPLHNTLVTKVNECHLQTGAAGRFGVCAVRAAELHLTRDTRAAVRFQLTQIESVLRCEPLISVGDTGEGV